MTDARLIERWLPIAALGEESVRERRIALHGNALPPNNSLHVWWARRPLVASRATVLASVLPEDADRQQFLHALGIHGDPVLAKRKIETARRTGVRVPDPYGYERAFRYSPSPTERDLVAPRADRPPVILDPTAGGGSIPFEAARLGCAVLANDLNPVAALVTKATVEWPLKFGAPLKVEFDRIAVSPAVATAGYAVGPAVGSDHLPVLVDLLLPPSGGRP
jgi:putative DNA methylase